MASCTRAHGFRAGESRRKLHMYGIKYSARLPNAAPRDAAILHYFLDPDRLGKNWGACWFVRARSGGEFRADNPQCWRSRVTGEHEKSSPAQCSAAIE